MKKTGFWIRAGFSALLLGAFLLWVDIPSTLGILRQSNLTWCALVIILALADRVFMALKWHVLTRALGLPVTRWRAIRTYLASSFAGMFLPTSVGGDVVRLFLVGTPGQRETMTATIVMERLLAFIALLFVLLLASCAALFVFSWHGLGIAFTVAVVVFVLAAGFFAITLFREPPQALARIPGKVGAVLRKLVAAYQAFRDRKSALGLYFVLSMVEHCLPIACNYFVARALGLSVQPLAFFVAIPMILIFSRLPISLDGLGIQEGLYVVLFQVAGMSPPEAGAMAFLARILNTIALLPGGLLLAMHRSPSPAHAGNRTWPSRSEP